VPRCAPRLDARLVAATANADNGQRSIAEIYRRVARLAERLGLPRPSYESIRRVAHQLRACKSGPTIGQVLLDIDLRRRPPEAIIDGILGMAPKLPS
jgi:hypothetical protein